MKYKAVVFDYGGVLILNSGGNRVNLMNAIGEALGISGEEFRKEYFKHNYLTNVEGLPWIDACLSAVSVFDDSKETELQVRKINDDFNRSKTLNLNIELLDIIAKLNDCGYKVAILSNYTGELRDRLQEQGIDKHFDQVFVSAEIGYQKPDPQSFFKVCQGLDVEPKEMIFIDDTSKSLETADEVGYTPILFQNNEQLFTEFEKMGVLPKR